MRLRRIRFALSFLALALAVHAGLASAADAPASPSKPPTWTFDDIPADVLTDGFLEGHPDLFYRKAGTDRDKAGDLAGARKQYQLAARYGDKPAQARLGEMWWNGQGGRSDRALGFLWMSLAAERHYELFEAWKMYYWEQLTDAEKRRARGLDQQMLREYGDAAAKPRQETAMRRELSRSTGSMLGHSGQALYIETPNGGSVQAERFYARDFWNPQAYWRLQDRVWSGQSPGRVTVGEVQDISHAAPADDGKDGKVPEPAPAAPPGTR
ncbi:MAG: sel1 repeat family protein [Pseudoxanthomonas sp.]